MAYVKTKCSPPAPSPLVSEKQVEVKEGLVPVSEDPAAIKIAELLENVTLLHKPVSLQPRGLINKGNWCYINAVSFLDVSPEQAGGSGLSWPALHLLQLPQGC
jgi:ubiquitin carboxyl-terminal hydrolase 10